jgi:MFS family permease
LPILASVYNPELTQSIAYLLTTAALQLLFGKFYTYWRIKTVFLTSIGIFEVGSALCGAAPNSTALIIGRAIAGLGSSGIFSGSLLILGHSVPLVKRPAYIGIIGGMYGIASIAGPLLGGAFTDKVVCSTLIANDSQSLTFA